MSANGSTAIDLSEIMAAAGTGAGAGAATVGTACLDAMNLSITMYPAARTSSPPTIQATTGREAGGIDRDHAVTADGVGGAEYPTFGAAGIVASGDSNRRTRSTKASAFWPPRRRVHCTSRNRSGTLSS